MSSLTPPSTITTRRNCIQSAVGKVRRTLLHDFDDVADDVQQDTHVFVTPSIAISPKMQRTVLDDLDDVADDIQQDTHVFVTPSIAISPKVRRTLLDDLDDVADDIQQDTHVFVTPSMVISPKVRINPAAMKLLNSIERIQKIVTERIRRMRNNPSAKKAEWDRKMRILMSMR
ncbi:hypothetical protein POM88_034062 [Heracleum sosnowskyi]|uniref:Uncharacterized protein n=1 Tax=Heracleum sosnowskyi TaxID=360622 RepID=A0AAD8HIJ5_9APIA|nr:hypothetical protein POM88_034062 [Heracleum sosnowskyi]